MQSTNMLVNLFNNQGGVVVVFVAAQEQYDGGVGYQRVFYNLGLKDVTVVTVRQRSEANKSQLYSALENARTVFFIGGAHLRITSVLGGTPVAHLLEERYWSGSTIIAGTSAGAAILGQTMIIGEEQSATSPREATHMAPGMGFLEGLVVTQHFTQRGGISRLLHAITQNPRLLGLGIDEDTAAFVPSGKDMEVVGSGCITIVDAAGITNSNLSETSLGRPLALSELAVHVLPAGYGYDLKNRTVLLPAREDGNSHGEGVASGSFLSAHHVETITKFTTPAQGRWAE